MAAQRPNNMNRLSALQAQYQNNQVGEQDLQRTKVLIQEQISLKKEFLARQLNGFGGEPELQRVSQVVYQGS